MVAAPLFSQLAPANASCLKKSVLSAIVGDLILLDTEAHHSPPNSHILMRWPLLEHPIQIERIQPTIFGMFGLDCSNEILRHAAFGQIFPTILYTYTSSFFGYIDVEGPLHKTQYPNYQCSQKRSEPLSYFLFRIASKMIFPL